MKLHYFLFFFAYFFSNGQNQISNIYSFGSEKTERLHDVIETSDNGFIIVGEIGNCENEPTPCNGTSEDHDVDPILFKISSTYELNWSKTYGQDKYDIYSSIVEKDNFFYLTGYSTSYSGDYYDVIVSKVDYDGNEIWTKKFGGTSCSGVYGTGAYCGDRGNKIEVFNDHLIILGDYASQGSGLTAAYYFMIDDGGNLINEYLLDSGGSEFLYDATISENGNLIATGTSKVNGGWEPWIIAFDENLNILFSEGYGDASTTADGGFKVITIENDIYMFSRYSWYQPRLNKLNSEGELLWSKKYEGNSPKDILYHDNAIYILNKANLNNTLSIIKTDLNGDVIWNKHFSYLGGGAYGVKIVENNNKIIIAGTIEYNSIGLDDVYMLEIDADGNFTNCLDDINWNSFSYDNNTIYQNSLSYSPYEVNTISDINIEETTYSTLKKEFGGCTDELACNYDSNAVCDDSSCQYTEEVDLGEDISTCEQSITLDAGEGYDSYLWSTGDTTQTIEVSESGDYSIALANNQNNNNYSMSFDGFNDYVSCPDPSIPSSGDFSVSVWAKLGQISTNYSEIISQGVSGQANFYIGYKPNTGELRFGDDWQNTDLYYPDDDEWHNFTVIKSSSDTHFYLDGILTATLGESIGNPTAEPLTIGSHILAPEFFNGKIDEVSVWNIALSENELNTYINCVLSGNEEGLVGYWNFEEGSGETVFDLSPNGNNGTINDDSDYSNDVPLQNCLETCLSTDEISISFNICGCTDETACNYDETATEDDSTCEYISPINLGEDITSCEESVILDAGEGYDSYLWSNGETSQTIEVNQSGNYSVSVENGAINNYSMSFDGDDDYISCFVENFNVIEDFSVSFWVKTSSNNFQRIINKDCANCADGEWLINLTSDGRIEAYIEPGGGFYSGLVQSTSLINDNNYHHVSFTRNNDNGTINLYIDGVLESSYTNNDNNYSITNSSPIFLASIPGCLNCNEFEGKLDEVSLWSKVISYEEVQEIINCSPSGSEEGLVGYWNFEEESEQGQVLDLSGNGSNGTINGGVYSDDVPLQSCSESCLNADEVNVTINICGCTDPLALNYDSLASYNDDSCNYCSNDTINSYVTACDSVFWNNQWYNESGIYEFNLPDPNNFEISSSINESYNWCFGWSAGIDFNTNPPSSMICSLSTSEGCSTVSDSIGNLLFYTNGVNVWDKNHTMMPNGYGLTGNDSSTQSAMIIKKPDSPNIYYLFTVDGIGSGFPISWDGLYYSEIDMNLNNGFGDVVDSSKNTLIVSNTSEKLTAIKHENGNDFWIITRLEDYDNQNSNTFHSYLLNSQGVNLTPIISNVGPSYYHTLGYLKASPDGKKIAAANARTTGVYFDEVTSDFNLFDFDKSNGYLSNPMTFGFEFDGSYGNAPYGLEFSPNSKILYVSSGDYPYNLTQFDLTYNNQEIIDSTRVIISELSNNGGGALQLGPDGKIYHAKWSDYNLGVINNPNVIGYNCNYDELGFTLSNGTMSRGGLPNFYNSMLFKESVSCDTISLLHLTIQNCGCMDEIACNYDETATEDDGSCEYISPIDLGEDIVTCEETIILDAGEDYDSYLWSTGETTQTIEINQTGTYTAETANYSNEEIVNNYSMNFDGDSNLIVIDNSSDFDMSINQEFTILAKIKTSAPEGYIFQAQFNYGYYLWIDDEGRASIIVYNDDYGYTCSSTSNLADNEWNYICAIFDNSSLSIYVNGILENTINTDGVLLTDSNNNSDFSIGSHPSLSNHTHNFDGLIDELTIWDIALNNEKIVDYMTCSPSNDEPGLISYWNFEEGSGDTVYDLGSNNNGTINGAVYSDDVPEQSCQINLCSSFDEIEVEFNNINIIQSDTTICKGDTIQLYVNEGIITQWSNGEVSNSILISPSITTAYSSSYEYGNTICEDSITVTVANCGCLDETACNYCSICTIDDNSCWYIGENECDCEGNIFDCNGVCNGDSIIDECGVCDGYGYFTCWNGTETCSPEDCPTELGCTDPIACNYCDYCVSEPDQCIYPNNCDNCEDYYYNQNISLEAGWSIVSTYICPNETDISNIASNIENLIIVKDENGNVFWPIFNINTIGDIIIGKGYQIKVSDESEISFTGDLVSYDYPIEIPLGWSIIGYLHQEPYLLTNMYENIINEIKIIKDQDGNTYWPEFELDNIIDLNPGQGYKINLFNSVPFSYPASYSGRLYNNENGKLESLEKNTGNNMTLGIHPGAWSESPNHNDLINIFNSSGILVGSSVFRNEGTVITIWGDDELTGQIEGMINGENYILELWSHKDNMSYPIHAKSWAEGNGSYSHDGISIIDDIEVIKTDFNSKSERFDILGRNIKSGKKFQIELKKYDSGRVEKTIKLND